MYARTLRRLRSWKTAALAAVATAPLTLVGCIPFTNPVDAVKQQIGDLISQVIANGGM